MPANSCVVYSIRCVHSSVSQPLSPHGEEVILSAPMHRARRSSPFHPTWRCIMRMIHVPRHERVAMIRYGRVERLLASTPADNLDPWRLVKPVRPEEDNRASGSLTRMEAEPLQTPSSRGDRRAGSASRTTTSTLPALGSPRSSHPSKRTNSPARVRLSGARSLRNWHKPRPRAHVHGA